MKTNTKSKRVKNKRYKINLCCRHCGRYQVFWTSRTYWLLYNNTTCTKCRDEGQTE